MPAVPLKLKKASVRDASAVLENEVAIEQDGFHLGKKAVVAVEMGPARLHHADFRIGKVMDDLHQPFFRGHEIGIEDGDEFARRAPNPHPALPL